MKVKAVIKKIKTHFKKQGIDIDVEYSGTRWSFYSISATALLTPREG